ncbi:MAG TPA: hypothetical protein PLB01_11140 [Thermoanaerobaculia bacterium]|nr:hypothetical protein [Thermoanaerobaculia bacterium]
MKSTKPAVAFAALALAGIPASAQVKEYKPPAPQVAPALDKIAMTEFASEPATIPPGATKVKLWVTVKNLTGGPQAVTINGPKIRILRTTPSPDALELETAVVNLAPGATQRVGQDVNIAPGTREYFARVDPDDTLHEPLVQRANNEKRLRLAVPQISGQQAAAPGSQPQLETQALDYQRAKNAGAQFSNGIEGSQGGCVTVGQLNSVNWVVDHSPGVVFIADCSLVPNGVRATPEAFTGFRLKNGWRVKDYSIGENIHGGNADWQWRQVPAKGTDDPSMKMHVWASANGRAKVHVKVTIEGPAGTNPYQ